MYARKAYKPDFVPMRRTQRIIDDHSSDHAVTNTATAANPDLLEHKRLR